MKESGSCCPSPSPAAWFVLKRCFGLGSRPAQLSRLSDAAFYYPLFHAHFSLTLFFALLTAVCLLPRGTRNVRRRKVRPLLADPHLLRLARGFGLILLLALHAGAQEINPKEPAAKRLVQLINSFDSEDWSAFHAAYVASFVSSPPDVPMGNETFRQGTGGFDLRKLEEDTPTHATVMVQERNSDQFARISLEIEPEEPHRIVQLRMGPIDRPAEFPYGTLTDAEVMTQARTRIHALVARDQFSGVIIIQHNGHTVYSEALGEADRSRHIANTMDTRFRIGSMNKMFKAVATLQLVAAGNLD